MLVDLVLSLQNGYENRGLVMNHLFKFNYYDCCIKIGNDLVPQKILFNNKVSSLKIIPGLITKFIPCLIGTDSIIDIGTLKREMDLIQNIIDVNAFLYISNNTCIKYNSTKYFISELDPSRILNIFGFMPNFINIEDFLSRYKHPYIDCAGGYFNSNGLEYNINRDLDNNQSILSFKHINPRTIGNIIGVINLFEVFKGFIDKNNQILYSYMSKKYDSTNQILYNDYLLSYKWLNLDKVNTVIKKHGVNIVCCYGINLIKYLDEFTLILNNTQTNIENVNHSIPYIKEVIVNYFKVNSHVTEILFF